MFITVRTEIDKDENISTRIKYYQYYEMAHMQLTMERDLIILELAMKYTKPEAKISDYFSALEEAGTLTYDNNTLEWLDFSGECHIKYEILKPENLQGHENIFNSNLI